MNKFKSSLLLILAATSCLQGPSVLAANQKFSVPSKSAIAVDVNSGKILYSQNAKDSDMGIASITKLMTVYMVYKAIDEGKIKWTDQVPISDYAFNLTQNSDASNIPLVKGAKYSVKDLVDAALLPSANSAAIALAEYVGGSEVKFVDQMRAQLKSWGVKDANIINASGLNNEDLPKDKHYPASKDNQENTMSAEDVAVIATHLVKDYPKVLDITKKASLIFDQGGPSQTTLYSTDQMLYGLSNSREGVDGLKTGSTNFAGECFVATTNEKGFRIVTVVLKADDPNNDDNARFEATADLMDHVYKNWAPVQIALSGAKIKDYPNITVEDGKTNKVSLVAKTNFTVVLPTYNQSYSTSFKKKSGTLLDPISKGQELGLLTAKFKDKNGYLPGYKGQSVPLVAKSTVTRANPFIVGWNHFVRFVNEEL